MSKTFTSIPLRAMLLAVLAFPVGLTQTALAQSNSSPEPHTAAAVIAADEGWSKAETSGDTAYVDALLLPEYRSISTDGSTHDKAAILAHTSKANNTPENASKASAWRAIHPSSTSVVINGDVAIVTFALDKGAKPQPVLSCDIFVYRDGRWHAIYSQHTEAGK